MNQKVKHSIIYFFLIVFVSVKMSNLHAFFHIYEKEKSKIEHCDVCKFTLTQDAIPALGNATFNFEVLPLIQTVKEYTVTYTSISYNRFSALTLYNKPPPFLS